MLGVLCASLVVASAQGVREHTRMTPDRSTAVTDSQASELTLTVTDVAVRPLQIWVRAAGRVEPASRTLTAYVLPAEAALIRVGQRVRAFPPESRSSMYQARVTAVAPQRDRVMVKAELVGPGREQTTRYLLEIVTETGSFLTVPNEAIIETDGTHVVYVQQANGQYAPRTIQCGTQGELFTEVLDGLTAGERVVTFGSFFVDAEHKLKGS